MRIQDVMTRPVACVHPKDTVADAARIMDETNVGILPVVEDEHLCGVITDRDIALGCEARGHNPHHLSVGTLMTRDVLCCHEDDEVGEVLEVMAREHLRRIPVLLHRQFPRLVGIVSIDDLADAAGDPGIVKRVLDTKAGAHPHAASGPAGEATKDEPTPATRRGH